MVFVHASGWVGGHQRRRSGRGPGIRRSRSSSTGGFVHEFRQQPSLICVCQGRSPRSRRAETVGVRSRGCRCGSFYRPEQGRRDRLGDANVREAAMDWPIAEVARMPGMTARTLRLTTRSACCRLPGSGPTATATTRSPSCCGCSRSSSCGHWAQGPRSAGSWPSRSTRWTPCADTTADCSPSGTGSTLWPAPSPARSPNWSSPGRTAHP